MAAAKLAALAVSGLLVAPASLAQPPTTYDCLLVGNGTSIRMAMRFAPGHIGYDLDGEWRNFCEEPASTCSQDAEGRIQGAGVGPQTGVIGDVLFDPGSGLLTITLVSAGKPLTVTGTCRREIEGLS